MGSCREAGPAFAAVLGSLWQRRANLWTDLLPLPASFPSWVEIRGTLSNTHQLYTISPPSQQAVGKYSRRYPKKKKKPPTAQSTYAQTHTEELKSTEKVIHILGTAHALWRRWGGWAGHAHTHAHSCGGKHITHSDKPWPQQTDLKAWRKSSSCGGAEKIIAWESMFFVWV